MGESSRVSYLEVSEILSGVLLIVVVNFQTISCKRPGEFRR